MEENQNNSLTEEINDGQDKANIAKNMVAGNKVGAVKDTAKLAGKKLKDFSDNPAQSIGKSIKRKVIKYAIPVIAVLLIPILFFGIIFEVANIIKEKLNEVKDTIVGWVDSWISGDGINVKDEDLDEFIEMLEQQGISMIDMGFGADDEELEKEEGYNELSEDEKIKKKARKYIKKYMEASLVTQTVWTNTNGITGIPGGIRLERHNAETDTIVSMTYVDNIEEAAGFNVYSLDSSGNVIFKGRDGSIRTIDTSAYEQYSLPVMYFIDLCLLTQNPKYVEAIADAIIDSANKGSYSWGVGTASGYTFSPSDYIIWRNNYSKEDFVNYIENLDILSALGAGGDYRIGNNTHTVGEGWNEFYASHAEEWFDICTSNGLDPLYLIAWSCNEKGYGSNDVVWRTGNILSYGENAVTGNGGGAVGIGDTPGEKAMYLLENIICPKISNAIYYDSTGEYHSIAYANGYDPDQYEWTMLGAMIYWYGGPGTWNALLDVCSIAENLFEDFAIQYVTEPEEEDTEEDEEEVVQTDLGGSWMTIRILDSCTETTRSSTYWITDEETGETHQGETGTNTTKDYTTTYYLTAVNHLLFSLSQTYSVTENDLGTTVETGQSGYTRWEITTSVKTYGFTTPTEQDPVIKCAAGDPFVVFTKNEYTRPYSGEKLIAYNSFSDGSEMLFELMDSNLDNEFLCQMTKYVFYMMGLGDFGVTDIDDIWLSLKKVGSGSGRLSVTTTTLTKEEFVEKVQSYSGAIKKGSKTAEFRDNAEIIYDICVNNNINPILCAAQAWGEQNWIYPSSSKYNYWGIAVYNGQDYGNSYSSIEDAVQGYCDQINSQLSGDLYSIYQARAAEFATVNSKFKGDMSTIYDVFSAYAYIGDGHTLEEEADYAASYVDSLIEYAVQIFGEEALNNSVSGVAEFALQFEGLNGSEFGLFSYRSQCGADNVWYADEWCAMFVSFCFDSLGLIPDPLVNSFAYVPTGYEVYMGDRAEKSAWRGGNYIPSSGDIIYFGNLSHVGIVVSCDGSTVYTVEGNVGNQNNYKSLVVCREYPINSTYIYGYGNMNY